MKWTRFFKTIKEEVSNNYIVVQQKRKKKNNNDVVVKTIVTVYWLVLLNFYVCVCDHALATNKIGLNEWWWDRRRISSLCCKSHTHSYQTFYLLCLLFANLKYIFFFLGIHKLFFFFLNWSWPFWSNMLLVINKSVLIFGHVIPH